VEMMRDGRRDKGGDDEIGVRYSQSKVIVKRMEAMARQPLKNINPLDIFMHARGFHAAEDYIASINLSQNPQLALEMSQAAMVLAAFNCELFLKCLICIETGLVPSGHYLDELFDQLAPGTRARIEHIWDSEIVPMRNPMWTKTEEVFGKGDTLKRDLPSAIKAGRRAFEKMRYSYEPDSKDSQFIIGDLPRLLYYVILEKKPEWTRLQRKVSEVPGGFQPYKGPLPASTKPRNPGSLK
jgi:hypothetical protein